MTQPIQGHFRAPADLPATAGAATPAGASPAAAPARTAAARPAGESVVLSDAAQRMVSDPVFDRDRVEAIKQSLREGSYPLNARRTAESFLALERWIDD